METPYRNIHQDLIDQCKQGNQEAQFGLYKLYYKSMYNTSLRMTGNSADAEDIMQEAFLSAFRKINTYEGNVSFGAWLKKIVVNRSLDHLKKRRIAFDEIDERVMDERETSEEENWDIDLDRLKKAIMQLQENYRVVLTLFLLEGYDHDEISEILGITNVASRTQFCRAKQKLRQLIVKDELYSTR